VATAFAADPLFIGAARVRGTIEHPLPRDLPYLIEIAFGGRRPAAPPDYQQL